jgi:hypothetical protein
MRKQIIMNDPATPTGFEWSIYSIGRSESIMKHNLPPFSDFDEVIFKQQKKGVYWLCEFHRDGIISFGYVQLKQIKS